MQELRVFKVLIQTRNESRGCRGSHGWGTSGAAVSASEADRTGGNWHSFAGTVIPERTCVTLVEMDEEATLLAGAGEANGRKTWTLLSNHAHVLVCLAKDPSARLRDIAAAVGITERGVFRVITELERGGVVTRIREGRRNRYELDLSANLRHPLEADCTVGELLALLLRPAEAKALGLKPRSRPRPSGARRASR